MVTRTGRNAGEGEEGKEDGEASSLSPLGTTHLQARWQHIWPHEVLLPIVPITSSLLSALPALWTFLIRSTLSYGSLTAILAAFYVMGVVVSQVVVGGVMHSNGQAQSPLVIVATTLASAALFQPVRRRIRYSLIDGSTVASRLRAHTRRLRRGPARRGGPARGD